jgi:hypothetical protein
MKYMLTLLSVCFAIQVSAQQTYMVENFSRDYYGKIFIEDTTQVFSKGWVAIYESKTNKEIIKVSSDELAMELHDGKVLPNIVQAPYGEQSLIIYEDFNFDGNKDLAIEDGQNSCYHGPSFQIYLAVGKGFKHSNAFTELAQENCGMFQTDGATKTISTMTKDGCCWHQFSEYKIVNNIPKAVHIITEEMNLFPYATTIEETWNGKTMLKNKVTKLDLTDQDIKIILSFVIPANNKQVVLFTTNEEVLQYALLGKDSSVELSIPLNAEYQNKDFQFIKGSNDESLSFKNKNATYKIYEQPDAIGISININGKTYNWKGNKNKQAGSLEHLINSKFDNVE